jgi:hypothetical protein
MFTYHLNKMKPNCKSPTFNQPFKWIVLLLSVSMFGNVQCKLLKWKSNNKSLVEIKSRIQAPMGVAFIEVGSGRVRNVPKVKVTFIDSSGFVMSSNGIPVKTIEVSRVMSIGLSPKARFSTERPYLFFIRAEAEGYMTNVAPVVVTADVPGYIPIFMAKLDNLPPGNGLAADARNISGLSGGTFQKEQRVEARSVATGPNISLTIPGGTQLFYANRKKYDKNSVSYRLLCGNPLDSAANRVFPGGFQVNDALNEEGQRIVSASNPSFFTSAGWFSFEMTDDKGESINEFNQAIKVEMAIPAKVIGLNGAAIKVGDRIPLWSMRNETGQWRREGAVIVEAANNGLKATFNVTHLSTWNLDFSSGTCPAPISVAYTNSEFPNQYYTEYIREDNGNILKSAQVNLSNPPGSPLQMLRVPTFNARLLVRNGNDVRSNLRGRSTVLNCNSTGNQLGLLGSAAFPCVQFRMFINPGQRALCGPSLWYKEGCDPSTGYFFHAGSLVEGFANVPSSGASSECFELRFTTSGPVQEIVMSFNILYGSPDGSIVNGDGEATINGVAIPGSPDFTYSYIFSPGTSPTNPCSRSLDLTINPGAITGLTGCN